MPKEIKERIETIIKTIQTSRTNKVIDDALMQDILILLTDIKKLI